jgi:hypothetical protein
MWREYSQFSFRLNGICIYMNKIIQSIHCKQSDIMIVGSQGDRIHLRFETIEALSLSIWRKAMLKSFENHSVKQNIIAQAIIDAAKNVRQMKFQVPQDDIDDLKSAVEPYLGYELYVDLVERPILNMASQIYSSISIGHDFNGFIRTLEAIKSNEIAWATIVFSSKTVDALRGKLQQVLIIENFPYIEENIDSCLQSFDFEGINCLYRIILNMNESKSKIVFVAFGITRRN